jgi:hypothetical protein
VIESVKIELTDAEWMSLIDGDRPGGLLACCANISELRDRIISAARMGGEIHAFEIAQFRITLGHVLAGHDIDPGSIPALDRLREQVDASGPQPVEPRREILR